MSLVRFLPAWFHAIADFRVYQRGNGQKLALKAQLTVTAQ